MDRQSHLKQLVAAAFERWRDGTGAPFELLADDATWTITGANPLGATYTSRQAFLDSLGPLTGRLAEPIRPTTTPELYADGDTVCALFEAGAPAIDGERYQNIYSWYMTFAGDEITRVVAFFDGLQVTELFDRVPAPE